MTCAEDPDIWVPTDGAATSLGGHWYAFSDADSGVGGSSRVEWEEDLGFEDMVYAKGQIVVHLENQAGYVYPYAAIAFTWQDSLGVGAASLSDYSGIEMLLSNTCPLDLTLLWNEQEYGASPYYFRMVSLTSLTTIRLPWTQWKRPTWWNSTDQPIVRDVALADVLDSISTGFGFVSRGTAGTSCDVVIARVTLWGAIAPVLDASGKEGRVKATLSQHILHLDGLSAEAMPLRIYDLRGTLLWESWVDKNRAALDLARLPKGVALLRLGSAAPMRLVLP